MPHTQPVRGRGREEAALAILSLYLIIRGLAYTPIADAFNRVPTGLALITAVFPLSFWAAVWILTGIACAWGALMKRTSIPLALTSGLLIGWGFSYLYTTIDHGTVAHYFIFQDFFSGLSFLTFGTIIGVLGKTNTISGSGK